MNFGFWIVVMKATEWGLKILD